MGIKFSGTKAIAHARDNQRSKQALGKKNLELGREYILLFPKKDNDIVAACIVGKNCDYDSLGISFGRLSDDQMQINPETGRITDMSGMNKWAALSSILYKAAKAKDIEEVKKEAKEVADKTGSAIDQVTLNQSITKITEAYDGRPRQGDEAAIAPTKRRLVNPGIDFNTFTEAVLIPLDKYLKPEYDKALTVEVRLSNKKIDDLNAILSDPNYNDIDDPDGFLEIKFSYKGADRKEAGKNPYLGQESAVRKISFEKDESGEYVDPGVRSIKAKLKDVTHDADTMFARAGTVSFAKTAADVEAAMRKYLANNRMLPLYIDMQDELTRKHAKDIIELGGVFSEGSRQYQELKEIVESERVGNIEDDESITGDLTKLMDSKTTKDVASVLDGNQELRDMLNEDTIEDI